MKLASILLARTLAFVETFDLAPDGKVFYPDLVKAVVHRYKFQKFPQAIEDLDEKKGIVFEQGLAAGNVVIQKFTIFNTLLVLETRASTADSQRIILEMLEWGRDNLGLTFRSDMVKQWGYVSDVAFYSDAPLLATPALLELAHKTAGALSDIWKEKVSYEPIVLSVGHDPLARKNGIAPFTLQRRAETPFTENKYFSEAPLPTDMHLRFLEDYEKAVSK
jgi:hypothetical protein